LLKYNAAFGIAVTDDVDPELLRKSWNFVSTSHDIMRATFGSDKDTGLPVQRIADDIQSSVLNYHISFDITYC
jgi:hypothetical protein